MIFGARYGPQGSEQCERAEARKRSVEQCILRGEHFKQIRLEVR
jgi:ribosomal protein L37AE/L43A